MADPRTPSHRCHSRQVFVPGIVSSLGLGLCGEVGARHLAIPIVIIVRRGRSLSRRRVLVGGACVGAASLVRVGGNGVALGKLMLEVDVAGFGVSITTSSVTPMVAGSVQVGTVVLS